MTRPAIAPELVNVPGGPYTQTAKGAARVENGEIVCELQHEDGSYSEGRCNLQNPQFANMDGVFVYMEAWPTISARLGGGTTAPPAPSSGPSTLSQLGTAAATIGGQLFGADGSSSDGSSSNGA